MPKPSCTAREKSREKLKVTATNKRTSRNGQHLENWGNFDSFHGGPKDEHLNGVRTTMENYQ